MTKETGSKAIPADETFGEHPSAGTDMHTGQASKSYRYTIATLTNDREQYKALVASFKAGGFGSDTCEFIFIDTAQSNAPCAYEGLNHLLNDARGDFVILCHQDIRLLEDDRDVLDMRLDSLTELHPEWAVAGNAGGISPGKLAIRITDPHGDDQMTTMLPSRVSTLDENFLIIRRSKRLSFSANLKGFHLYGADICLVADILGLSSYVINFHLQHLSAGNKNAAFKHMEQQFRRKWSHALRPRWIQTTCTLFHIAGHERRSRLAPLLKPLYRRLARYLPGASGWTGPKAPDQRISI